MLLLNFPGIKCVHDDGAIITESLFSKYYNIHRQEVAFKEDMENKTTSNIRDGLDRHETQIDDLLKRINYTKNVLTMSITKAQLEIALTNVTDQLIYMADSIILQEETMNNKTLSIQGDQNKLDQQLQNEINVKAVEMGIVFTNLTEQLAYLENITKFQEESIRSVQDDLHNGIVVISALLMLVTGSLLVMLLRVKCKSQIDKQSAFSEKMKMDER